jgi:hypothetical protein
MVKLSSKERRHIADKGKQFTDALARATMCVRSCGQLVGLEKVRAPIAWRAALTATGYEQDVDGMVFPKDFEPTVEINEIAAELYVRAVKAAQHS